MLSQLLDPDLVERPQSEHLPITSHNGLCATRPGTLRNPIIRAVVKDAMQACILRRMSRSVTSVAIAACLSLLSLQLSGLHLHAGQNGVDSSPHGTHVHGVGTHDHDQLEDHRHAEDGDDHNGDRDLSLVELCAGAAKLLPVLFLGPVLQLPIGPSDSHRVVLRWRDRAPIGRASHWRPPLRGPPG